MPGQAHIVDVGLFGAGVGKAHGVVAEPEAVYGAVALGYGKEGLSVIALDSCYEVILPVHIQRTAVEHGVDAEALHEVRVGLGVHVIPPEKGRVVGSEYGVLIPAIDTVAAFDRAVFSCDELFIALCLGCKAFAEFFVHDDVLSAVCEIYDNI